MRLDGGLCVSGIRAGEGRFDGTGSDRMSDVVHCWRLVNSSSSDEQPQTTAYDMIQNMIKYDQKLTNSGYMLLNVLSQSAVYVRAAVVLMMMFILRCRR